jgi:hypothetical protein
MRQGITQHVRRTIPGRWDGILEHGLLPIGEFFALLHLRWFPNDGYMLLLVLTHDTYRIWRRHFKSPSKQSVRRTKHTIRNSL